MVKSKRVLGVIIILALVVFSNASIFSGVSPAFAQGSPIITSVNPDSSNRGERLDVTINGTGLTNATEVSFGRYYITINNFTVISDNQIAVDMTI